MFAKGKLAPLVAKVFDGLGAAREAFAYNAGSGSGGVTHRAPGKVALRVAE